MNLNLNKRQKIVISSFLLTIGLFSTQLVDFNLRFRFLGGLAILAYILSFWSLWEGLNITKAFMLLILPTFFTVAVASFYFLLPVRWLTRLPVAAIFGLTFYLLLLAQNVFNVASPRTITLSTAASTATTTPSHPPPPQRAPATSPPLPAPTSISTTAPTRHPPPPQAISPTIKTGN